MSATVSPATGKPYGISRTCTVLAWPRSSFYFQRSPRPKPAGKPGPKPKWSDAEVLQFIHRDLERSPFQGEGHRKVWARLRILDGVRVGRKRLLRIMREHKLLSPYRGRRDKPYLHTAGSGSSAPLNIGTPSALAGTYPSPATASKHC